MPIRGKPALPDVVLFDERRNWVFFIEAVTSHGPVSPKRVREIEAMMTTSTTGPIYISAFPDLSEFKRWIAEIAWETEVWIAEMRDHMIALQWRPLSRDHADAEMAVSPA
jgi:type II restriction enzyme